MPEFNKDISLGAMKQLYNAFTTNKLQSRLNAYTGTQNFTKNNRMLTSAHPYSRTEKKQQTVSPYILTSIEYFDLHP